MAMYYKQRFMIPEFVILTKLSRTYLMVINCTKKNKKKKQFTFLDSFTSNDLQLSRSQKIPLTSYK